MRGGFAVILVGAGFICACDRAFAADANRINIQAVVTGTYDSNVARSDAATAQERGVVPGDFITEPAISVDIRLPVSRQVIYLNGSAGYDFYAHNSFLNAGNVGLHGGVQALIRRCKATVDAGVVYQQSDLQLLSLAATRNQENTETISLDGSCGGDVGLAPSLTVSQQWTNNSAAELQTSNFNDLSLTAGIGYRRPLFGELSVFFSYDDASFPNRNVLAPGALLEDGYRDYSAGVRYDRRFGAKIEGDVKVAYTVVHPDDPTLKGSQGVTFDAELTFRASRLLQAKLSLARAVNPTIRPDVTYGIEGTYSGELDYTPGRKLKLAVGASGVSDAYRGVAVTPALDVTRETGWDVFGSAHYQLDRRIGFGLDIRHERRDANLPEFSYSDDRVALSIMGAI